MARRIKHYPYVGLRLERCELRTCLHRMSYRLLEVVDLEIDVHHHQRLPRLARPHRSDVVALRLERQVVASVLGWGEGHPLRRVVEDGPAEQPFVEAGELACIGRV